ncbi:PR domain zinc finger protein 10 [Babesia ovis]|uniref:PR domain zinc finger protein 10 n=1 Tax=Babesia ovis TaxID=5869 RepID=A0A9W5T868_BABOV|nr:PR domain zinc finger protein 10 [Babesia ovis]
MAVLKALLRDRILCNTGTYLIAVSVVLVYTQLKVLAELLVELLEVFLLLSKLSEELQALLNQVLADNLKDLVLLKDFSADVKRKVLRVDNTLDEAEPLRDKLFTVVHDEHTTHIELDVVLLLAVLEHVEWSTLRYKEKCLELKLTLDAKVLNSQVVFPVVAQVLVEAGILFTNGERDELAVLFNKVLQAALLEVLALVILEVQDETCTTLQLFPGLVLSYGEVPTSIRFPHILVIIVVLGDNSDLVSNEVRRVETHTELTDHGHVSTGLDGLHKSLGSGFGDGTQVVDQVSFGHTDTSIFNGQRLVGLVSRKADLVFGEILDLLWVLDSLISDLLQCITGVTDEFTEENLFVTVKCVDNKTCGNM